MAVATGTDSGVVGSGHWKHSEVQYILLVLRESMEKSWQTPTHLSHHKSLLSVSEFVRSAYRWFHWQMAYCSFFHVIDHQILMGIEVKSFELSMEREGDR